MKQAEREHSVSRNNLKTGVGYQWLPRHVFAYYSGPSDRLEEHFREHQRRFYRDLLGGKSQPFRPLFYARPVHSQFVLLSFFTGDDPKPRQFLEHHLGILDLESALFILHAPPWAKSHTRHLEGDNRFWGARGVVKDFLGNLFEHSLAPMRLRGHTETTDLEKPKKTELLYLYLPDKPALRALAPATKPTAEFFKELESTYISDLIQQVRIRVKIRNCDGSLTFRELSEGEQQLLTVVGLLRFTRETEALFLLDEPDTHLNPVWSMKYLEILKDIAEPSSDSQVLMATHDPLVIAELKRKQVVILHRDEITGRILASSPDLDPQGLGIAGILTSDMFGLGSTIDEPTLKKINRRLELFAKGDNRTATETDDFFRLSEELTRLGFNYELSDPYQMQLSAALAREHKVTTESLTTEDRKRIDSQADKLVNDFLKKTS